MSQLNNFDKQTFHFLMLVLLIMLTLSIFSFLLRLLYYLVSIFTLRSSTLGGNPCITLLRSTLPLNVTSN